MSNASEIDALASSEHLEHRTSITPLRKPDAPRRRVAQVLENAGIIINGNRAWDIRVLDQRFYLRVLAGGSVALGESYMDGWWDADALDEFFVRVHRADVGRTFRGYRDIGLAMLARLLNRQARSRAQHVALEHYDLGNDLFEAMLGRSMQYTCGYWRNAGNLDEAQENKLRLIANKLHISAGCSVLELGAGFGTLARFLASEYGCRVVAYNISDQQVRYGRELCRGLPVRFEARDYREAVREPCTFDRVVAVGLCEHVGYKNYRRLFELAHDRLAPRGLFFVHTIGADDSRRCTDAWIDKYIFPGGMMPSVAQLGHAMDGLWTLEDWHNFGTDYDRTLLAWWRNFESAWPALKTRYSERFCRMWKYYILSCAAAFRARKLQLWQIVASKGDIPSYICAR